MQYKITLTDTGKKKVYVNPGVREGIYLYPGEIKKLRLEDGSELEQDEFERIRLEYALPRAKHRAIAILAKRDKTEQELREKLLQSLTDTQSLEEAISYMKACGYVDDTQYARDYLYFKKGRKSFLQIKMYGLYKPHTSNLKQIICIFITAVKPFHHTKHQPKISFDVFFPRQLVPLTNPAKKLLLLLFPEKWEL